jgi:drug/metabolite transporter (DMT)-like permease
MTAAPVWRRLAMALLLVVPALFASNNVAARFAAGVVEPATLSLWRWAGAGLLLLPLAAAGLFRKRAALRGELPHILALGFMGMTVVSLATYAGARETTASNIGLIYAATPAIVLAFDWFFSRIRLTAYQIFGLVLCVGGIALIVLRGDLSGLLTARLSRGDLVICAGTVAWAAYSVLLKYWPSRLRVVERAALIATAGALTTLPFALFATESAAALAPSPQTIRIALTVGVLAGALLILMHAFVTDVLGPRVAVVLLYLIPLYNILLARSLLGETLELYQAAGGAFVLAGIACAMRGGRAPVVQSGETR